MALAVDDAAELALRQGGRRESALPELGHDQRPDLVVLVLASLEFGVPPADELLDRLAEYVATSAMTRTTVGCGRPVEAAR